MVLVLVRNTRVQLGRNFGDLGFISEFPLVLDFYAVYRFHNRNEVIGVGAGKPLNRHMRSRFGSGLNIHVSFTSQWSWPWFCPTSAHFGWPWFL